MDDRYILQREMKKKRIVIVIAALSATIALGGCTPKKSKEIDSQRVQNQEETTKEKKENNVISPTQTVEDNTEDDKNSEKEAVSIRQNGSLPEDEDDLSDEEKAYYSDIFYNALKILDIDTLKEYISSDDTIEKLTAIRDNSEYKKWWDRVVGDTHYFADYDLLIGRSLNYVFASWYTDCKKQGTVLPELVEDISPEEGQRIYDTYYIKAPYVCSDGIFEQCDPRIEDGKITFDPCDLLYDLGGTELFDIIVWDRSAYNLHIGSLLLGNRAFLNVDNTTLLESMPEYEKIMALNMDDLVEITQNDTSLEHSGYFWETFEKYYLPEESRAIIQKCFDSGEVYVLNGETGLYMFIPISQQAVCDLNDLSDKEKEEIADLDIVKCSYFSDYPGNKMSGFDVFCDVADYLEDEGRLQ